MFKLLTRVLITLLVIGVLLWFFAPRLLANAANSLINPVNTSLSQAQGLAQFIPAGVNPLSKTGDLQIKIDNLIPSTPYEITLDQGQCGSSTQDLGAVNSDPNGSFYIEFPVASLNTNSTWYVNIHQQGVDGPSVACGQLETNLTSGAQVIDASHNGPNVFDGSQSQQNDQTPTANPSTPNGLPNTGANPGNGQQYHNNQYPRKY